MLKGDFGDSTAADFLRNMWGYSDGKNIFINVSAGGMVAYLGTETIGRIIYLVIPNSDMAERIAKDSYKAAISHTSRMIASSVARSLGGGIAGLIIMGAYNPNFILDSATGELFKLNHKNIEELFSIHPDLLEKYKLIRRKYEGAILEEMVKHLIIEYNKRHKELVLHKFHEN